MSINPSKDNLRKAYYIWCITHELQHAILVLLSHLQNVVRFRNSPSILSLKRGMAFRALASTRFVCRPYPEERKIERNLQLSHAQHFQMGRAIDIDQERWPGDPRRHTRRLSDKILIAFHDACDKGEVTTAEQLLQLAEMVLARPPMNPNGDRRRTVQNLTVEYNRLGKLRELDIGTC